MDVDIEPLIKALNGIGWTNTHVRRLRMNKANAFWLHDALLHIVESLCKMIPHPNCASPADLNAAKVLVIALELKYKIEREAPSSYYRPVA